MFHHSTLAVNVKNGYRLRIYIPRKQSKYTHTCTFFEHCAPIVSKSICIALAKPKESIISSYMTLVMYIRQSFFSVLGCWHRCDHKIQKRRVKRFKSNHIFITHLVNKRNYWSIFKQLFPMRLLRISLRFICTVRLSFCMVLWHWNKCILGITMLIKLK